MKKIKLNQKLSLNKQVVTELNSNQLNALKGGVRTSIWKGCDKSVRENCGAEKTGTVVKTTTA